MDPTASSATELSVQPASTWRSRAFSTCLLALLGALYFFSPMVLVVLGWFQEPFSELGGAEVVSHRVHEILFGTLFTIAFAGAVSQLRSPYLRLAGMLQALVVVASFFVVLASLGEVEGLGFVFLGLAVLATALHPGREQGWWRRLRPRPILGLVALAGLFPLATLVDRHLEKAALHAANHLTHWGGVAAFGLVLVLLSLLAFLGPPGHRLVAGSLGFASLLFVAASWVFPFDASARPDLFSVWLLSWGMVWLAVGLGSLPGAGRRKTSTWLAAGGVLLLFGLAGLPGLAIGFLLAVLIVVVANRRRRESTRIIPGKAANRLLLVVLALLGLCASETSASNVSHGVEGVAYSNFDRQTCLNCHGLGVEGATAIPHETQRACDPAEGGCWGGRSDCVGCHRYDPALGGARTLVSIETAGTWTLAADPTPVRADQVLSLYQDGHGRR